MMARAPLALLTTTPSPRTLFKRLRYWWQMRGVPSDGHWREWEDDFEPFPPASHGDGRYVARSIIDAQEVHRHSREHAEALGYLPPA